MNERVSKPAPILVGTLLPGRALLERARLATNTAEWLDPLEKLVERRWAGSPQQSDLFAQVTRVLHELTRHRPLLLLIDDLQWADAGSISLLFHLGRQLRGSRLLVLGAYRTAEVAAGRAGKRHPLERVVNELKRDRGDCQVPVADDEDRRFVDELLDTEPNRLGDAFRTALFRQARGHPLFTVELLRSLGEKGGLVRDADGCWVEAGPLDWGRLPMRVEAVIAERIGRLPEELRRLLRVASVQGEYFTAEVAARLLGIDEAEAVRHLSVELDKRHRLVRAQGLRRLGEQCLSRYAFRHILFQRYLYDQLDAIERTHLHEGVGNALLSLHGDEKQGIAGELAQHFELAALPSMAVKFLCLAGRSAARVSAHEEAISHLTRALELLEEEPGLPERKQRQVEVLTALGPSLIAIRGYAAADVERVYLRSRKLCRELGEEQQEFWALWGLWVFHHVRADVEECFELARRLMRLAEPEGDSVHLVQAHSALGLSHVQRGEIGLARRHLERVITLSPQRCARSATNITGEDVEVASLSFLACALWIQGCPDQAVKRSLDAYDLARRLRHPFSQAFALNFVNYVRVFRHEPEVVRDRAAELIELSADRDFPFWHGLGTVCLLWARTHELHGSDAERDEILSGMRCAIDDVAASGARISQTLLLAHLAEAYLRYGRIAAAREALDAAFSVLEATGERHTEAELYRLRGELAVAAPNDGDQAEPAFRQAIAIARRQGAGSWELRATISLSRLLESQDRRQEARADLVAVTRQFTEGFDTPDFQEAQILLAELG